MPPCKSRALEKDIANIFCGYWTRREGKTRKMNKNHAANASDCPSLTLKRDKDSANWVERICSKHLKSRFLTWVYLSFSISTSEKAKSFQVLYILPFFTLFFPFAWQWIKARLLHQTLQSPVSKPTAKVISWLRDYGRNGLLHSRNHQKNTSYSWVWEVQGMD